MKLFPGMSAVNLIAAAFPAISAAAGWWFKLWPDRREQVRLRHRQQLEELENLRVRLRDDIAPWAGNEWDENSHSPEWYDPSFHVIAFNWEFVERFNRLVLAGEYPRQLTSDLRLIEELSLRFHESLAQQDLFRNQVANDVVHRVQTVVAASRAAGFALSDEALEAAVPDLRKEARDWLQELYRCNRRIHVDGIGRAGQAGGLHQVWSRARNKIETTQARLRAAGDPWWSWVGHVVAGILVLVGLLFLFDFGWSSLVGREAKPTTEVPSSSPDGASSRTKADTVSTPRANASTHEMTDGQKELWSLDHPVRVGCLVRMTDYTDSLVVMNAGFPVQDMRVTRLVFFYVRPYREPANAKHVRFLIGDYYRDELDGDYEGSQRVVFGLPWNLELVRNATSGLVDSLNHGGLGYAGIEVGRAVKVLSIDRVGNQTLSYFWCIGPAGTEPSAVESISRKRWAQLAASADSIRKTGRVLTCGTKTPKADVERVIRDCIKAVAQ